jgi:hypothetical protein
MGRECAECGKEYGSMCGFDIKILKVTIFWCFECASKQVYPDMTDWRFFKIKR